MKSFILRSYRPTGIEYQIAGLPFKSVRLFLAAHVVLVKTRYLYFEIHTRACVRFRYERKGF